MGSEETEEAEGTATEEAEGTEFTRRNGGTEDERRIFLFKGTEAAEATERKGVSSSPHSGSASRSTGTWVLASSESIYQSCLERDFTLLA
jgi:hypothetical protein